MNGKPATASAAACAVRGLAPERVVRPADRDELAHFLAGNTGAVVPVGGATRLGLGAALDAPSFTAIDLTGLDRVIAHAVDDLTITVEPGITLARLQEVLAAHHQWLPLDPPFPGCATAGGMVATAAWGPLRPYGQTPRRHLIGVGVLDGRGQLHRGGGRVVKNVAGYDLMKLECGAMGTLGVLVDLSFRLSPRPEAEVLRLGRADEPRAVAELARRLLREGLDPAVFTACDSGSARELHGDIHLASPLGVVVGFTGFLEDLERQEAGLEKLAGQCGVVLEHRVEGDKAARLRAGLVLNPRPGELEIRAHALPTHTFDLLHDITEGQAAQAHEAHQAGEPILWYLACPTLGVVRVLYPAPATPTAAQVLAARRAAESHGGRLIVEACPDALAREIDVWGPAGAPDIMAGIKKALDPDRRFNPGRFAGGL